MIAVTNIYFSDNLSNIIIEFPINVSIIGYENISHL